LAGCSKYSDSVSAFVHCLNICAIFTSRLQLSSLESANYRWKARGTVVCLSLSDKCKQKRGRRGRAALIPRHWMEVRDQKTPRLLNPENFLIYLFVSVCVSVSVCLFVCVCVGFVMCVYVWVL
jgi:hypothetical protein